MNLFANVFVPWCSKVICRFRRIGFGSCCSIALFSAASNLAFSQAIDPASYFPVSIGDRWSYYEAGTPNVIVVAQIIIRDSFQIGAKTYFRYDGFWWGRDTVSGVIDGKVYYRYLGVDQVFYNLSANIGDTWQFSLPLGAYQPTTFTAKLESRTDTVRVPAGIFINCMRIHYRGQNTSVEFTQWLAPNVGVVYRGTQIPSELREALVNGVQYPGMTGMKEERTVPKFALNQNYPNPFNPNTIISYSLPKTANVSLKVLNALGQEVAVLVNEQRSPGNYQVQWNANVPSGIYFYRLQAGEFVETKTMTLLR